jgi:serine/threonine-protein kinase
MASVFLAYLDSAGGFRKPLAVKLLHQDLATNPILVEMFFHEAKVASLLPHPNIAQVFELGMWEGSFFLAMEYLEGETLAEVMQAAGSLDPRLVCELGMQACEALEAVHEATDEDDQPLELVHLDVSPQNLVLTTSGSLKLIDFGISRSRALSDIVPANPFRAKYSYTSPERLQDGAPDRRSDLFSLGTVLWELLAGRRLFSGENELQTMYRVSQAEIPSLAAERADIPESLDKIIAKSLERDPDARYQTAMELYRALHLVRRSLGPAVSKSELASFLSRWFPADERRERTRAA